MIAVNDWRSHETARSQARTRGGTALEMLLHPLEPAAFLEQVWERQPCVVTGRASDYYSHLLRIADVDAIISTANSEAAEHHVDLVRYEGSRNVHKPIPRTPHGAPDLRFIYEAYQDGYSIVANSLQQRWQPISRLCADLQQTLNHPVGAYLFLTPRATQAFAPHWDVHDVFILQLEGAKHWQLYAPMVTLPLIHMQHEVQRSQLGQPTQEVHLQAGDVLYIPRGHIHQALTSDVSSLHLTVWVHAIRWADLLEGAILRLAEADASLQEALPVGFLQPDELLGALEERLHELLARAAAAARIDTAIVPLAKRFAYAQQVPLDGHFVSLDQLHQIDLNTVVERRSGVLCVVFQAGGHTVVEFAGNRIEEPLAAEPALQFIAHTDRFAVWELPDCLSDTEKRELVRRLLTQGLLACAR
jgi:ribosomal protein L16 Arg81 hydroxylase